MSTLDFFAVLSAAITSFLTAFSLLMLLMDFRSRLKGPSDPDIELVAPPGYLVLTELNPGTPLSKKYILPHSFNPLVAEVQLIFANHGDKFGYARVTDVRVQGQLMELSFLRESIIIPSQSVEVYELLLRNMPKLQQGLDAKIVVSCEWGGVEIRKQRKNSPPQKPHKIDVPFSAMIQN